MNAHWSEDWLGWIWRPDFDCADFAALVTERQFGRRIALPIERASGVRGRDAQIVAFAARLAKRVSRPDEGDAVLMRAAGRRAAIGHHVGIWCSLAERGAPTHVLHLPRQGRSRLDAPDDLLRGGLAVTESYQWL